MNGPSLRFDPTAEQELNAESNLKVNESSAGAGAFAKGILGLFEFFFEFGGRKRKRGKAVGAAKDILFGKWLELRGRVRQRWSRITADDLTRLSGEGEEFAGVMQQRFGYAAARSEIRDWLGGQSQPPVDHDR